MKFRITITGTCPLLLHNARLSNPIDPIAKEMKKISKKRTKTDQDYEELAHLEFLGGLYHDEVAGVYMPAENIERCIVDSAKMQKLGQHVKRGMFIETDINPIAYRGPRDPEDLWATQEFHLMRSVKVTTNRVMRCRPMFPAGWRTEADGLLDESVIDFSELDEVAQRAGSMVGLGTWRPRYGRFKATLDAL